MAQLSKEAFGRARDFLKNEGRPLERALFEHYFEGAPVEPVLAELTRFQNSDGGFGHGIEPDIQTPASSAMPTAMGLQILKDLGRGVDDPLVRGAVQFYLNTYNPETKVWRIVAPEVDDAPHAPWWNGGDEGLAQSFGAFRINPRADIVSLLHHYSSLLPAGWLDEVTEDTLAAVEKHENDDFHSLINAINLAETPELPEEQRRRIEPVVREWAAATIARTPEEWREYGPQPLTFASRPDSLLAGALKDDLDRNFEFAIQQQGENGGWAPTWDWGDAEDKDWLAAKRDWTSNITLNMLRQLRAFGRIEGI